jgi:methylated-DNA-protein-cysteine methyltransferase-like protein
VKSPSAERLSRTDRAAASDGRSDLTGRVLDAVGQIPIGRVLSYSDVAEYIGLGSGRTVGRVLATGIADTAWHRVVRQDGTCAEPVREEQLARLRAEGVPVIGQRIDMARARWDGRHAD